MVATLGAATTKPAKPSTSKTAAKPDAKAPAKPRSQTRTTARSKAPRVPAQTWRNRQIAPSKDRYREIQQALYEQGYLTLEPTGVWDKTSIEALKQFQTDQKLSITGRISALTLINLGLGPNHPMPTVPLPAQN
jgi:hypothetical protein